MNNVILIEDREEYANKFKREAKAKNINIVHKKSLEGLKKLLPEREHQFSAVILDIKCLLVDDQPMENANFIGAAMTYLNQNVPSFPRFILTGDDHEFHQWGRHNADEKLFLKTPESEGELFKELQYCIDNCENLRIKREYPKVFEVFEKGWMDAQSEAITLKIIKEGEKERDFAKFKGICAEIRAMQERIYKSINAKDKSVVPDNKFKPNGMIKFNDLMHHLSGYPVRRIPTNTVYQNGAIVNISNAIYWSCGEYIHDDPSRTYFISHNTVKSMIYGLLELLIWAKQYLR